MPKQKEEKKLKNKMDKVWRKQVKKEFDGKCIICGEIKRVNCHHLIPREISELRFAVLNGVCLCPRHHKYSYKISAHKNSIRFLEYYKSKYLKRYLDLLDLIKNKKINWEEKQK